MSVLVPTLLEMHAKKVGIAHLFCTNEHTFKPRVCSMVQKRCAMPTFLASISKSEVWLFCQNSCQPSNFWAICHWKKRLGIGCAEIGWHKTDTSSWMVWGEYLYQICSYNALTWLYTANLFMHAEVYYMRLNACFYTLLAPMLILCTALQRFCWVFLF